MRFKHILAVCLAVVFLASGVAMAADKPKASFSGKMYLWWLYDTSDDTDNSGADQFNINRVYLIWKNKISDVWSTRVTLDVQTSSNEDTQRSDLMYVKHAYAQAKLPLPDIIKVKARFGITSTGCLSLLYKATGDRWIGYNPAHQAKYWLGHIDGTAGKGNNVDITADMGAAAYITVAKMVTIFGGYFEGGGFGDPNEGDYNSKCKAYNSYVDIHPFMDLHIAYMFRFKDTDVNYSKPEDNNEGYHGFMIAWISKAVHAGFAYHLFKVKEETGYVDEQDGTLMQAWVLVNLKQFIGMPVLANVYWAQGDDKDVLDAKTTFMRFGVGYKPNSMIQWMVGWEVVNPEEPGNDDFKGTWDGKANSALFIRCEAKI